MLSSAIPDAVTDGPSGELLHRRLFDIELALANIARFAETMARLDLPGERRSEVRLALLDLASGDNQGAKAHAQTLIDQLRVPDRPPAGEDNTAAVVLHRFAGSVIDLCDAMTEWMALSRIDAEKGTFQSSVVLLGGWLPGSAHVSSAASLEGGSGWGERAGLARYTRNAIKIGVAAGAAIALGDLISPQRFYWAVLAAFIMFMGAHNAGEQIRKALFRVAGTVIGIGVGSLLVSAVGHHASWSIAIVLVSLFLGLYLFRISYAFLAVAITVTVSQLYQQLGEFTNSLLVVRLEETALGSAVAIVVVMLVLPLHTRQVLRVAIRRAGRGRRAAGRPRQCPIGGPGGRDRLDAAIRRPGGRRGLPGRGRDSSTGTPHAPGEHRRGYRAGSAPHGGLCATTAATSWSTREGRDCPVSPLTLT